MNMDHLLPLGMYRIVDFDANQSKLLQGNQWNVSLGQEHASQNADRAQARMRRRLAEVRAEAGTNRWFGW
jgi:hypothetical protein